MKRPLATRRIGSLALLACAEALLAGTSVAALQEPKKSPPSQKEISRELAELERDDQKDQDDPTWTEATERTFASRQKARRDRVVQIVDAGLLASTADWANAAMLLQHGSGPDDYLLAHVLSIPPAGKNEPFTRFLAAATLDRFLQSTGRAQVFSTQSTGPDPSQSAPMKPFDDSMSETIRAVFELPPTRRESADKDKQRSKTPSAAELPKLLKLAEGEKPSSSKSPESAPATADEPEWLLRAREIVAAGALKSKQDLFLAAQLMGRSSREADLLSAHVLALAATFRGHDQGLATCARTLDRYLVAIGRPPRFGAVADAASGSSGPTSLTPLHDVVLRAYGLDPASKKPK